MAKLCSPGPDPYTYSGHSGIDFLRGPSWLGKPFYASGEGVIRRLSHNDAGGYWVVVKYDAIPYEVGYAHMNSHRGCPAPGTRVHRGTMLGFVGATGTRVTGPHIHVEIIGRATASAVWDYFDKGCWVSSGNPDTSGGGTVGWTDADKQRFLTQIGLDTGGIGNGWGPKSNAATKQFQTWVGLNPDGVFGKDTIAVATIIKGGGKYVTRPTKDIQSFFASRGYPVGPIDDKWGIKASLSTYMLQKAERITADAKYGKATDEKAFPPAPTPEPVPGRNATSRPLADIQTLLGVPVTNVWDKATSDAVGAFQDRNGLLVDHIWGVASDGLGFPPAGSIHGVDYSFARPAPSLLIQRGVKHVGRYLHDSGKGLTRAEYDALREVGLEVWLIFERDGKELLGGRTAGIEAATIAENQRLALGLPAQPIYFNVDYDAPAEDMDKIADALRGVADVIGLERVGLYGGFNVIRTMFDAGLIMWGFQTYAWSGGKWDPRAQLQQWANGQWGGTVDFTRAMVAEYGQHPVDGPGPGPEPEMVSVPRDTLVEWQRTIAGWLA